MQKEIIICVMIVSIIVFGNNIIQQYTQESIEILSGKMQELRGQLTEDSQDNEKLKKDMEEIYEQWNKRHDKMAYFIEHDELEKVETNLTSAKSFIESHEYVESINEIDKCTFMLGHIEDKYAFNLQNIF